MSNNLFSTVMGHWIVAKTKQHQERWAAENVVRQGFEFYLPRYEIVVKRKRKQDLEQIKSEILFPSYLFVKTEGAWKVLLSTFGIQSIILRGDQPAIMPVSEIHRLQHLTNEMGLVELPSRLQINQQVKITSGSFEGCTGLYQGQTATGRQMVLMNLLGRRITILFHSNMLDVA